MAYTTATVPVGGVVTNSDGTLVVTVVYTGNAGEPAVSYAYRIDMSSTDASYLRGQAMARIAALNNSQTVLSGIVLPKVLDVTTPLPGPAASTFGAYLAATGPFTPAAAPTDMVVVKGSATKTVRITRCEIVTVQTTAGINRWDLIKRSTANTGGSSSAVTMVPLNTTFPAATASVLQYATNPGALGVAVGTVWSGRIFSPSLASVVPNPGTIPLDAGTMGDAIVLNGVSECLALNFAGASLPTGLSVQCVIGWQEQ